MIRAKPADVVNMNRFKAALSQIRTSTLSFFSDQIRRIMSISSIQLPRESFAQPQKSGDPSPDGPGLDALLDATLQSPIDFPPLKEVVFDGDRIALALLTGLEHPRLIATAVLKAIEKLGRKLDIQLVAGPRIPIVADRMLSQFKEHESPLTLHFHQHDLADPNSVAYLAASPAGRPIDINRILFDADIVIPIGSASGSIGLAGVPSVYPEFSNAETVSRFQSQQDSIRDRSDEIIQADLNIGADLCFLAVSGPGGVIRNVLFGHRAAVTKQAVAESDAYWQLERQADGQLVIATIESDPTGQSWHDFFRALAAASSATDNVQQIVVYSSIDQPPSAENRLVFDMQFESDPEARCRNGLQDNPLLITALRILEDKQVFLKSRLGPSLVEDLGLGCIESDDQVQRIVDRAESGLLLRDAHRCTIRERTPGNVTS